MRSVILALLAPAAIALTASAASATAPMLQAAISKSDPVTIDVAYRYARGTTVRGPRGGVYHGRTVVAGRGGVYGGGAYAHRGVYARVYAAAADTGLAASTRAEAFTRAAADTGLAASTRARGV